MKWLFLLFPVALLAQTITPSQPTVVIGQSITLTASSSVTWSLSGSGSLSTTGPSTSTVYTAPSSVVPAQVDLGWPVGPNDSIFHQNISGLPVHSASATWLANSSGVGATFFGSWGLTYTDSTTGCGPTGSSSPCSLIPFYGDGLSSQPTYATPLPLRQNMRRETGNFVSKATNGGTDHHSIIVQTSSGMFYEIYNDLTPALLPTQACHLIPSNTNCNVSSEIVPYSSMNYAMTTTGTDAAGLPLAPLTLTLADVYGGIKHPLRFTARNGYISNNTTYPTLWPAVTPSNGGTPNAPPYGALARMKSSVSASSICSTNAICLTIVAGLKNYGMYLADIGTNNQVTVASDLTEDPTVRAGLYQLTNAGVVVNSTYFEFVNQSSLQETTGGGFQVPSTGSYAVNPGNSAGVTPSTYAQVTAGSTKVSIAIQPAAIGLRSNVMEIAAGMSGYTLPSFVTPSSLSQTVTWVVTSGVGSISSGNVYTPPATTGSGNTAVLTATAAADSNVHATLQVYVLTPEATSGAYSGNYGIDVATNGATTTSNGGTRTWNSDYGLEATTAAAGGSNFYGLGNYSYDSTNWYNSSGTLPEYLQYRTLAYAVDFFLDNVVLPNGNYLVRWMQGTPWNGQTPPVGSSPQDFGKTPVFFSGNGLITNSYYDWQYAVGYQVGVPSDIYVPVKVTNNILNVAEYPVVTDPVIPGTGPLYPGLNPTFIELSGVKGAIISALEIIPDATTAHWALDTQGATKIASGQTIQLFIVDYYTGVATGGATWSVTGLGASITSGGLLTLASGTYVAGQPIVATATNGTYSATATLYTTGTTSYFR